MPALIRAIAQTETRCTADRLWPPPACGDGWRPQRAGVVGRRVRGGAAAAVGARVRRARERGAAVGAGRQRLARATHPRADHDEQQRGHDVVDARQLGPRRELLLGVEVLRGRAAASGRRGAACQGRATGRTWARARPQQQVGCPAAALALRRTVSCGARSAWCGSPAPPSLASAACAATGARARGAAPAACCGPPVADASARSGVTSARFTRGRRSGRGAQTRAGPVHAWRARARREVGGARVWSRALAPCCCCCVHAGGPGAAAHLAGPPARPAGRAAGAASAAS